MGHPSPNPIDQRVGARLAALREGARLSQDQIGDRLGMAARQIDDYERGRLRATGPELYRLCQVLECPVSALFDGWDDLESRAVPGSERHPPEADAHCPRT